MSRKIRFRFGLANRIKSAKIIGIVIVIQVKLFVECPVHELDEEYLTLSIKVGLFPLLFHIACVDSPPLKHLSGLHKLLLVNALVLTIVDLLKGNKELVVLSQVLEHVSKFFSLSDIIVTV